MKFVWTLSWVGSAVLVAIIVAAIIRIPFFHPAADSVAFSVGEHRVEGNVIDVDRGGETAGLTLDMVDVDDVAKRNRVLLRAPVDLLPNIGDRISVFCTLEAPQPFDGFAYDKFLAIRDVYATCRTNDLPLLVRANADHRVLTQLAKIRAGSIATIRAALPEPQATLLAGLLLGDAGFSTAWRDRFLATGTSHIVAASGYNVSMVVKVLFGTLIMFGLRRQRAFWILLGAIAVYAVFAGLSAAVVRAGVMASIILLTHQLGRKTSMRNIVLLAVAAMLTIEPRLLLYDVGFQLSVVSTIALVWAAPIIEKRLRWIPEAYALRDIMASTIAATACTLPIVIISFGQVSLVGPFVNLLVLPVLPFAMAYGAIGFCSGVKIFMIPAWGLLSYMLGVIRSVAMIPFAVVTIPMGGRIAVAIIVTLFLIYLWRTFFVFKTSHDSPLR